MSKRREEKILPEYSSEYLIAKDLAYKQGFKDVLVSSKSWGPFDIVVYSKANKHVGFGVQVKTTGKDYIILKKEETN